MRSSQHSPYPLCTRTTRQLNNIHLIKLTYITKISGKKIHESKKNNQRNENKRGRKNNKDYLRRYFAVGEKRNVSLFLLFGCLEAPVRNGNLTEAENKCLHLSSLGLISSVTCEPAATFAFIPWWANRCLFSAMARQPVDAVCSFPSSRYIVFLFLSFWSDEFYFIWFYSAMFNLNVGNIVWDRRGHDEWLCIGSHFVGTRWYNCRRCGRWRQHLCF